MPTARELLERADAIIRRGRQTETDDLPVLTDVVGDLPAPAPSGTPPDAPTGDALNASVLGEPKPEPRPCLADPVLQELADHVYLQVMQSLDLYTEGALQQRMAIHLEPLVERAARELVAAVNANLGALLRAFLAESIERQFEQIDAAHGGGDPSTEE